MVSQIAQNGFARRPGLQAFALLALLTADGLLVDALDGPPWLTALYVALGVAVGLARVAVRPGRAAATDGDGPRGRPRPGRASGQPAAAPDGAVARAAPAARTAIGYVEIGTAGDRAALFAHHSALAAYAEANGLVLRAVVHDVERPTGEPNDRPGLRRALECLGAGDAEVLAVARLAHVADSVADLSALLRRLAAGGRALVAIDLHFDTSTREGRLAAAALEGVGAWERTRFEPPARPPQGRAAVADRPELHERIRALREQGLSLQAIADRLNAEGVPTVRGGTMWRPSSVQRAAGYQRPRRPRRGIEVPRDGADTPDSPPPLAEAPR